MQKDVRMSEIDIEIEEYQEINYKIDQIFSEIKQLDQ